MIRWHIIILTSTLTLLLLLAPLPSQLSHPSHPSRSVPASIAALAVVLRDPAARSSFVGLKEGGVAALSPFIAPATSQQQMQVGDGGGCAPASSRCRWVMGVGVLQPAADAGG